MNKFKPLGSIFFVFILFCFCLNIELTNQINRINLFNPDIDLRHFDIVDTTLEMAPWYNPMLNGHYLIHQPSADFLLVKTTDTEFIAANSTKLILMTLTSPMCPVAQDLVAQVETAAKEAPYVTDAVVDLVWDPPWGVESMSEDAQILLGF